MVGRMLTETTDYALAVDMAAHAFIAKRDFHRAVMERVKEIDASGIVGGGVHHEKFEIVKRCSDLVETFDDCGLAGCDVAHESSPVVAGSEAATSDAPAMTVQESTDTGVVAGATPFAGVAK